jgi:hypothetical protein
MERLWLACLAPPDPKSYNKLKLLLDDYTKTTTSEPFIKYDSIDNVDGF